MINSMGGFTAPQKKRGPGIALIINSRQVKKTTHGLLLAVVRARQKKSKL